MTRRSGGVAAGLGLALLLAGTGPSHAGDGKAKDLPAEHREWLELVEVLLGKEERRVFLSLEEDYQRDEFIAAFWRARDPDPDTPFNEFRETFEARYAEAFVLYGGMKDDRARVLVLMGEAADVQETDCGALTWPLEIWSYGGAAPFAVARPERRSRAGSLVVVFYQPNGGGPFRIWRPAEGYDQLLSMRTSLPGSTPVAEQEHFYSMLQQYCAELTDVLELILEAFWQVEQEGAAGPVRAEEPPAPRDTEWLTTYLDRSAELPAKATPLAASVEFRFPARHQSRVVTEGLIAVPSEQLEAADLPGAPSFNFLVTGEVLRDGALFEKFRYQFDLPARAEASGVVSLVFERYLRPGEYEMVLKVEDLGSARAARLRETLVVPALDALAPAPAETAVAETETLPPAAGDAVAATVELTSQGTDLRSGMTRFDAAVAGAEVRKVTFYLDDRPVLTKNRPPFSVELDLGSVPATHTVRAIALDAAGQEIATDEMLLNPGEYGFVARLIEPQPGRQYLDRLRARAEVVAPEEQPVERVEFYLGEQRVATLFQPPWVHSIELAGTGELAFVRVVAFLADGNSTEDLVVVNAADFAEDIDVRLVELYATVLDAERRPVHDLEQGDFRVLENGAEQRLLRFERLDDQPIYASLLLDTSGSMDEHLGKVRQAALGFLEQTIEPRDRASVVTFSDRPRLAAGFVNDTGKLAGALAGLRAGQSTALYDGIVFALYQFKGLKGQKALLLLTDGQDRDSEYTLDDSLRFAQTTGVTIYVIGLNVSKASRVIRTRLGNLAEATGGRKFFISSVDELDAIYAAINRDLRSRYLLVYQPAEPGGAEFRAVEVRVSRPGHEVRSPRGYYP